MTAARRSSARARAAAPIWSKSSAGRSRCRPCAPSSRRKSPGFRKVSERLAQEFLGIASERLRRAAAKYASVLKASIARLIGPAHRAEGIRHRSLHGCARWDGSVRDRRHGCANALREIGCIIGRLRGLVNQRASPQLVKWQRRVHPARMVEVAVDQAVEEMTDVEPAFPAGGVQIANDIDRAAVAEQMIELRPICKLVDPLEVDQQQLAHLVRRSVEAIEIYRLQTVVGTHAHDVTLVADHVDQLELLEEGGDGVEALAHLRPSLDGDTQRRCVVE